MTGIYVIARLFRATHAEALERMVLMAQGGAFAVVLYGAALAVGLLSPEGSAMLTAIIILSMALTPLFVGLQGRFGPQPGSSAEGLAGPQDEGAHVVLVGFGRVGQIVSQTLFARGWSMTTIDTDPSMITVAATFGFKVFYGDGARLDILQAAGATTARAVIVAIDDKAATRITELLHHACPLVLGSQALQSLGETPEQAAEALAEVRKRDAARLAQQRAGNDSLSGRELMLVGPGPRPEIPT